MTQSPPLEPSPQNTRNRRIALGLIVLTLACYWPVGQFDFINYDDPKYITDNGDVADGFTWEAFRRSFSSTAGGYRHPVTWWSHLLDMQVYGLNAGGHHVTNMVLHIANTVLLWWVLLRLTGAVWPSAWVAAMFAVHPTHLESVAWIAERKDVLSGLFMLLTILAYVRYTERRTAGRYVTVVLAFIAALMSKPMMVTLPGVLLLLDVWPLRRIRFCPKTPAKAQASAVIPSLRRLACAFAGEGQSFETEPKLAAGFWRSLRRPIVEKLPLLALSLVSGLITIHDTSSINSFYGLEELPLSMRLSTSVISYARYLGKLVWPTKLAIFYPFPLDGWPASWIVGSTLLFVALTAAAIWQAKRRPYLLVGWLWFVGTLLPVIGLLATGDASMADRYTYTPFIGLFIAIAWLARDWGRRIGARTVITGAGAAAVIACAVLSFRGVWNWRDSLSIMGHALTVTENNWTANTNYGLALRNDGRAKEAEQYLAAALNANSQAGTALINYAWLLLERDELDDALQYIRRAREKQRNNPHYWNLGGFYLVKRGRDAEALALFRQSLELKPRNPQAHMFLAQSLMTLGEIDQAEVHLRAALAIDAGLGAAHHRLGLIASRRGKQAESLAHLQQAIELSPQMGVAHLDYGTRLANLRRFPEALDALLLATQRLTETEYSRQSQARLNLGKVLEKLWRPMEAAAQFIQAVDWARRGVAARPNDPDERYQLALVLLDTGDPVAARAEAARAMELAIRLNRQYLIAELKASFPGIGDTTRPATTPSSAATTRP